MIVLRTLRSRRGLYEWSAGRQAAVRERAARGAAVRPKRRSATTTLARTRSPATARASSGQPAKKTAGAPLHARHADRARRSSSTRPRALAEPQTGAARVPDRLQRRLAGVLHRRAAADAGLGDRRTNARTQPTCTSAKSLEAAGKLACRSAGPHGRSSTRPANTPRCRASCSAPAKTAPALYLVAQGVLAGNENGNGETREAGQDNLYELHSRRPRMDDHVHRRALQRRQPGVGRATRSAEHRLPDGACLAERPLPGVHVGREPDRL